MIITPVIYAALAACILYLLLSAPYGHEDEAGFHHGKEDDEWPR